MTVDVALVYMDKASYLKVAQELSEKLKAASSLVIFAATLLLQAVKVLFFNIAHTLSIKTIALVLAEISPLWINFVRK